MKAVLGLDTSCYTTSVAAATPDGRVLAAKRRLLDVALGERGLRQTDAVYQHTVWLPRLIEELAREMPEECEWAAVCASTRPRPADDSFMPVFQAGAGVARAASSVLRVPFYETSHQEGHVRAALVDTGLAMDSPLLAFHLSGGTTELLVVEERRIDLVAATLDLHAGQLVDRVGVALGLPFPAGPALEALAARGQAQARLGVSMKGGDCHLSGAEAQAMRWAQVRDMPPEDIAAEVFAFLTRTIARMIDYGVEKTGIRRVLLAGGVASSALLRGMLNERMAARHRDVELYYARPELSGDNAVGVALLGAARLAKAKEEA